MGSDLLGAQTHVSVRGPALAVMSQWIGILLPPAAFAFDFTVGYAVAGWLCRWQQPPLLLGVLRLLTLIALGGAGIGAFASWSVLRRTPAAAPTDGGEPEQRARFMAILGLTTSAFFALASVATAIPRWVLNVCH
jgi:hypothetical protein